MKRLTEKQRKLLMEKLMKRLPEEERRAMERLTEKQRRLVVDAFLEAKEELALMFPKLTKTRVAS